MDENIQQTIEELYGVDVSCAVQTYRGVQFSLKHTAEQKYLLRATGCPVHRTIFTYGAMRYLYEHHFTGVELYLLSRQGLPYVLLGNTPYVAVPILRGKECAMEYLPDLERAAGVLAQFHVASQGFTESVAAAMVRQYSPADYAGEPFVRVDAGKLPALFIHRWEELKRFRKMAVKSVHRFDCAYTQLAEAGIRRAEAICHALSGGVYAQALTAYRQQGGICHKDYTAHNLLWNGRETSVLNLESCSLDLPVLDLANLIKRRMRKCGWIPADAWRIIQAYHAVRPLSREEAQILQMVLAYPQKLWRVVNKYYNSRKTWCEKSCLMKLGEIQEEQQALQGFLIALDNLFSGVYDDFCSTVVW